jgi:hypothetical protein
MKTANHTPAALAQLVDELAAIRADLADLKATEETYKAELIAAGVTEVDGTLHRVTITQTTPKAIQWEALARACIDPELLPDLIEDYTATQAPRFTVRITARKVAR